MIALVALVLSGLAVIVVTATVIGVTESRQSGAWRRIAAERRRSWERRQRQLHGGHHEVDAWGDEDTD
ncbi:hypothetical protein [Pseudonocardia sp. HH130630-07]|uniref:hypothetical protein n=1 Tax=Pseudonocardia sp. HH130630-07 TaxID=1690815 RepID=UPI000814C519|nr:hypothetical protein [Pseudonocardia sp. HH130630-07]ANY06489.1 hypothetical protein AFB00_09495 [Pseudonocardia sp. HH130630-07]